jgi:chemotaxis signal transduction protein
MGPPGWQGQVMVPVDVAFKGGRNSGQGIDDSVAEGLLAHAQSFCPPLYEIMMTAETIRRVVWNGQVMTAGQDGELQKLKTVLDQISETGARSNALFAQSISDLYRTVLASGMRDGEFVSRLLVDLLDRNLYERSDDCRWWALTPELRQILAQREKSPAELAKLSEILGYINSLYTVYTRIFVYDEQGNILVSSDRDGGSEKIDGQRLDELTLGRVRQLKSEQQYCVTPFVASPLYDERPTWVYHAAVRAPEDASRIVGGIGIVFDSAPELSAMLRGALGPVGNASAYFIDRQGRVLSSTDPARGPGTVLDIEPALLSLARGSSASRVLEHDGQYAIMGCTASFGYREFKVSDGYSDDLIAVVFRSFGEVREGNLGSHAEVSMEAPPPGTPIDEFATFWVGPDLFALPAVQVCEARAASELLPVTMGARNESVGMLGLKRDGATKEFIWVFDLGLLINGVPSANRTGAQVVVVSLAGARVGLLVSDLHAVPAIDASLMVDTPMGGGNQLVGKVIKANGGDVLVQLLNLEVLHGLLSHPQAQAQGEGTLPLAA